MPTPPKLRSTSVAEDPEIVLGVLHAVDNDRHVTQRSVARELGIALGLANAYLKRCARKGLIKVQQAPARRYAYYLTPHGFSEKSRLTATFLSSSFSFFRMARSQCSEAFATAAGRGWRRVVLAGAGDLAEIAVLCARDYPVTIIGVLDEQAADRPFQGLAVARSMTDLPAFDAVLVTDMRTPQATYSRLAAAVAAERVLTPAILKVRAAEAGPAPTRQGAVK